MGAKPHQCIFGTSDLSIAFERLSRVPSFKLTHYWRLHQIDSGLPSG